MGTYKISCPICRQLLEVQDEWVNLSAECPSCHQNITIPSRSVVKPVLSASSQNQYSPAQPGIISVVPFEKGKFNVTGDYYTLYSCMKQVFLDCEAQIQQEDPVQGKIVGKCRYGINPFGIVVTAIFYLNGNMMTMEISALLTDAFDTMGVCSKKVSEFSDRFLGLYSSFVTYENGRTGNFPLLPPNYSQRAGESYDGKAKVSFYIGLGGLLISFFGILALIFGIVALNGMSSSHNEEGKGFAIAGIILGLVEIIFMLLVFVACL